MNRLSFLQSLISLFGVSVLPKELLVNYKKIYLLQCFIRGFKYYKGPELIDEMVAGVELELQRERLNDHDPNAIAFYFNEEKIGFVPAEHNAILSRLMDADIMEFMAEINNVEKNAATWENVYASIYILIPESQPVPGTGEYTKQVTKPQYMTLERTEKSLTRISLQSEPDRNLEFNRSGNLVINDLNINLMPQEITEENIIIINKKRLPEKYQNDRIIHAIPSHEIKLDRFMDEDGYIVAAVDRLGELDHEIENLVERITKKGDKVIEAILKQ